MILDKHGGVIELGDTFSLSAGGQVYLGELLVRECKVIIEWISGTNPFNGSNTDLTSVLSDVWHDGFNSCIDKAAPAIKSIPLCHDQHGTHLYLNDSFEYKDPNDPNDGYIGSLVARDYNIWVEFSDGDVDIELSEYWDLGVSYYMTKLSSGHSAPISMLIGNGSVEFRNVI